MKFRLILAMIPVALAACDENAMAGLNLPFGQQQPELAGPPVPPANPQAPAVSPLQQPIEIAGTAARPVSTAELQTMNAAAFTASGNEPFWRVDVADGRALYRTVENQKGRVIPVRRLVYAGGVEYVGEFNARPFALNIHTRKCEDSMSGEKFPMVATLGVSGRRNAGCARPVETAAALPAPAS